MVDAEIETVLEVSFYVKPEFDWFQMEEIGKGMQAGVDYTLYDDPFIAYDKIRQVRKGLKARLIYPVMQSWMWAS